MPKAFASYLEQLTLNANIVWRRRDTRLYFGDQPKNIPRKFGNCVGAFYLQNPGSAASYNRPRRHNGLGVIPWGALNYSSEALLPALDEVLTETLAQVRRVDKEIAQQLLKSAYVQILNLSYIRNPADSKRPVREWRALVKARKVREDCPATKALKFIVFGWGSAYSQTSDSERIVRLLKKCIDDRTWLIFPDAAHVRTGKPIHIATPKDGCLNLQLNRRANYPCGGQNERTTYPALYCDAVAPLLVTTLTSNDQER